MQRSGKKSPTFWDIKKYLPAETRSYVMNFIALNVIFHNYEKFASNNLTFERTYSAESPADIVGPIYITPDHFLLFL
jgi:hypothetical protein